MIPLEWIYQAEKRIRPHIQETPLAYDPELDIYIKWENQQKTGSFKIRGALNKVLALQNWEQNRGFVTASAGNHGQGVALAASQLNASAIVFASEATIQKKIDAMRKLGAEVCLVPGGYGEAEQAGLEFAKKNEANWISPYNDGLVVAGQGTLAFEILKQEPILEHAQWVVPIGGGGLISGIGSFLTGKSIPTKLIGVQSTASAYFHEIYYAGNQDHVVELPSLADGLAGPVEADSITIPIVRQTVNQICLVSENDIAHAIAYAWYHFKQIIEGSGAVSLAAVITGKILTRPAVVVISGGNIQPETHTGILGKFTKNATN